MEESDLIKRVVITIQHYPGSGLPSAMIVGYEKEDEPCWYVEDDQAIFTPDCFQTREEAVFTAESYRLSLSHLRFKENYGLHPDLEVIISN